MSTSHDHSKPAINAAASRTGLTTVAGVGLAILLLIAVTGAMYARVALTRTVPAGRPLTVSTADYEPQDGYRRPVSYLGLIVAGRKAKLSFEHNGQLASLPVRPGTPVKRGQLIAKLDDAALSARRAATAADLAQARTELELAQLRRHRQQELRSSGAVSRDTYDETRLNAQALSARVDSVTAQLAQLDIALEKSQLRAPYDGIIADRYVDQGSVIGAGNPIVRLVETRAREAHVGVSAERAQDLTIGQLFTMKVRDTIFQAQLLSVRPDVNTRTRTTTVIFAVPEQIQAVDGEPVTLQLSESVPIAGGWLPLTALLEGQRGIWNVLRITGSEGKLRTTREVVEVLEVQGERAYVRGTLPSHSRVVAAGLHRITTGALVTVAE